VIHSCSSFPFFLLLLLIQFLNEFHFSLVIRRCDSQVVGLRNRRFWTDLEGSHQRNSACGIRSQGQPSWWAIWLTNVFIVIHDSLLITFWLIWCSHLLCGFDDKDLGPAEWICVCEDSVWPWPQCILRGLSSLWWHPAVLFSWPVNQNLGNWNWVCELACTLIIREKVLMLVSFSFLLPHSSQILCEDVDWPQWLGQEDYFEWKWLSHRQLLEWSGSQFINMPFIWFDVSIPIIVLSFHLSCCRLWELGIIALVRAKWSSGATIMLLSVSLSHLPAPLNQSRSYLAQMMPRQRHPRRWGIQLGRDWGKRKKRKTKQ